MAVRTAELDGVELAPPDDPDALGVRAGQLVADLVEPSRSETLDKLGESRQALDIAAGWVRAKVDAEGGRLGRAGQREGAVITCARVVMGRRVLRARWAAPMHEVTADVEQASESATTRAARRQP